MLRVDLEARTWNRCYTKLSNAAISAHVVEHETIVNGNFPKKCLENLVRKYMSTLLKRILQKKLDHLSK